MARFRRDAALVPFPRELLDQVVRALLDAAEQAPISEDGFAFGDATIDGVRLLEGRHLAAGARYRGETDDLTVDVHVPTWNRAGESRIEAAVVSGGHTVNLRLDLRMSARRLHTVRISGDYQGPKPFRGLRRARWEGEVRAEEWWSPLGPKASPISVRVVHPFAFADLGITRRKDKRGQWTVRTTARFGGRSLLRPFAAVGLAIARGRIQRAVDEGFAGAVSAWNNEVPRMVKHGMRERLDFEHRVTLKAVSREWAEEYTAALHQGIEELRFSKGRLVKKEPGAFSIRLLTGKHIGPGTRYRIAFVPEDEVEPLDVHVAAWRLDGPDRIEFNSSDDGQTGYFEIDSARRPTAVRAGFTGAFEGYSQAEASAEADLKRWWGDTPAPLLTGKADNPAGEASMTVNRAKDNDGEWTVDVTATVKGRAWAGHLVPVAGLVLGSALTRSFRESVDTYAEKWNAAAPGAVTPQQAADSTLRAVLDR
ncbi:hypothetical protein HUT06_33230 [Actinomadura sp. NAK00032]|uniref:hypothetical protein n=1 Tax=Actinomadura sp. NAK00032 TaxID=2742128 RepID=UPI001591AD67|nr:hypothetical protein [Actinomadura sp. NAK00032]QKW38269.1 hypothetical protein HUT06_33230 [Actinomadura sp. NAK00032]